MCKLIHISPFKWVVRVNRLRVRTTSAYVCLSECQSRSTKRLSALRLVSFVLFSSTTLSAQQLNLFEQFSRNPYRNTLHSLGFVDTSLYLSYLSSHCCQRCAQFLLTRCVWPTKLFSIRATLFARSSRKLPKKKHQRKIWNTDCGDWLNFRFGRWRQTEKWEWKRNAKRDRKFLAFIVHAVSEESEVCPMPETTCVREQKIQKRNCCGEHSLFRRFSYILSVRRNSGQIRKCTRTSGSNLKCARRDPLRFGIQISKLLDRNAKCAIALWRPKIRMNYLKITFCLECTSALTNYL